VAEADNLEELHGQMRKERRRRRERTPLVSPGRDEGRWGRRGWVER